MENLDSCINAMQRALMQSKDALQIELSVSLFVFTSLGVADLRAKKTLRGVYASAGRFDCLTPDSPSYSSVSRYMERSAALFEHVGKNRLRRAIKGKPDAEAIEAIIALIAPLELMSWDDVMRKSTGREPQKRAPSTPPTEQRRRASDIAEPIIHIASEHVHIDVAPEATKAELLEAIRVLRELLESL